jgi:hypothetical protein
VNFSLDPTQLFGLATTVRNLLPWTIRPSISNWIILALMFILAALVMVALHFVFREKPKIDWSMYKTGSPVNLGGSWDQSGQFHPRIDVVEFGGVNISGHALHQIEGKIVLGRGKKELPMFVILDGAWAWTDQIDIVPPNATITLGGPFQNYGVHWPDFEDRPTPDGFLRDFGAFTAIITIDGETQTWSFTQDDLRIQLEQRQQALEKGYREGPLYPKPTIRRKAG